MKAFIINLDHAVERWERLSLEVTDAGFEVCRVPAVFGDDLTAPFEGYSESGYRYRHGKRTNVREIGCYMSHLRAMEQFLATDDEHAVVLEDDVELGRNTLSLVEQAVEHAELWDLLRLSGLHDGTPWAVRDLSDGHQLAVNMSRQTGAGAYVVSRHGAEVMTKKLLLMALPYDHAFDREWNFGYKAMSLVPYPVSQNERYASSIVHTPKYGPLRYLTVFPYRAANESRRVFHRVCQYARVRGGSKRAA